VFLFINWKECFLRDKDFILCTKKMEFVGAKTFQKRFRADEQ